MSTTKTRLATMGTRKSLSRVEVLVPEKLNLKELRLVTDSLVEQIEKLTGHPCLSGTHDVIFTHGLEEVISVNFH